jgi:hypothetical protein
VPSRYEHAVLITQDCNLVADDEKESHLEIAFGYRAGDAENVNAYAQGKHPRLFMTEVGGRHRFVWDVRERQPVPKATLEGRLLAASSPGQLLDSDLREFRAWLGRRYSRPAFPDNFNTRLREAQPIIDRVIRSEAFRSIRAVFYLITERDQELPEGTPYHLRIIFCFTSNPSAIPLPNAAAEIEKFAQAVAACPGITLVKHEAISDARFPLQYLDAWQWVDFDARSYGSPESAPPRA